MEKIKSRALAITTWETIDPEASGPQMKRVYLVTKVTNTTDYSPGQYLEKRVVDALCAAEGWTVNFITK